MGRSQLSLNVSFQDSRSSEKCIRVYETSSRIDWNCRMRRDSHVTNLKKLANVSFASFDFLAVDPNEMSFNGCLSPIFESTSLS